MNKIKIIQPARISGAAVQKRCREIDEETRVEKRRDSDEQWKLNHEG